MRTIAILGSRGFLGKPIADHFSIAGWKVERLSRARTRDTDESVSYADIFDEESLTEMLSNVKPHVVLSTAWDTEHGKFWTSDLNEAYRDATLRFAQMCFENDVETFVGLGTMSEYGSSPGYCDADVTPLVSSDIYSKYKIETGMRLRDLGDKYGKQAHWARIFQAFGPNEKTERFVPGLISKLRDNEYFSIRTPNHEMDWIHTSEVASAILYAVENEFDHFIDVGTGMGTSVRELSYLICSELNLDESLLDFSEQIPGHEKKAVVSQSSQLLAHGWRPNESLRDRIRSLS